MSIASEITRIKTNIENAYTKAEEKGATIPENKNSENLAICLESINVGGGGSATKYGVPIDTFLGDVDENGVLQTPSTSFEFVGTGIKDVVKEGLLQRFYNNKHVTKADFPDLISVTGMGALNATFYGCTSLTEFRANKLTTVNANSGLYQLLNGCSSLEVAEFNNLTSIIGQNCCRQMFMNCKKLEEFKFDNLTTVDGSLACIYMFHGCTGLTKVSFPKLTTIGQADSLGSSTFGMFYLCSNITEIHFRSDIQSVVEAQQCYSNKFGASNATIYFDL